MNRTDFQQLADVRIAEAAALLALPVPMPDGAYYLAGYAVECALQACIAKLVNQHDFPDKDLATAAYTHNVVKLLQAANLEGVQKADAKANQTFRDNWEVVTGWSERSRYDRHSLAEAQELYTAIIDPANGVLPWIKARW
jgi:hypothetical protein